jgi:hypothetical protein
MTRTVAVCGSCTSRDNFASRFNPEYGRWFSVAAAVFQTSMISLMSPPIDPAEPAGEEETYQERITREDLSRCFLAELAAAKPDYLVLDFFADIHFGVTRLADGRYLTNNRWMLWQTEKYTRLKETEELAPIRIGADRDGYLALWTETMDRFAAFVAEHCPTTRVIVHRGLNVDEVVVGGTNRTVPMHGYPKMAPLNVARANRLWARLDDHAISTYGWDSIDLRAEGYTSYEEHPWKPFYVHYTPDYNSRFLAEMLIRDLADELDADDWAQVRAIADAGHEHAVNEAVRWTPIRKALDARLGELEGLGRLRGVKFALGQRIRETRAGRAERQPKKESR